MKLQATPELNLEEKKAKYVSGLEIECIVTSIQTYGLFVSLDFAEEGFINAKNLLSFKPEDFEITDIVLGKVIAYREEHHRFELSLVQKRT